MVHTDNMRPSIVCIPYFNGEVQQSSRFNRSTLSSTSTASSNLSGYFCSTGPCHNCFNTQQKDYSCGLAQGSHQKLIDFPPSPPPTNSDPKRSVPLPSLGSNTEGGLLSPISPRCRHPQEPFLTSVTRHEPLLSFPAPMTPPPTIPTPTLALPPADADTDMDTDPGLSSIPTLHDGWDATLLSPPSGSSFPSQNKNVNQLLSPISPKWTPSGIVNDILPSLHSSSDTTSVLLGSGSDHIHLFPGAEPIPYLQESDADNTSPHYRPILPHLNIPFPFSSPKSTWSDSPTSSIDFDEELAMLATPDTLDMDMDMDMPSTPRSLPLTPFTHGLTFTSDDKLFENDFREEKYGYYHEPPLHEMDFLPELDDILDSPSSPSLRSFSTLPSLEDDDEDYDCLTSPPSPGATLITLPGANPDDFLFPPDLDPDPPSSVLTSPFGSSSSSLLLLEDEGLPRSPSPENYDVDPASIEDSTDPDIRRLGELRGRYLNAERVARQLEQSLLERGAGAVHQRWEARRARKKEKERAKEIGAMLRLKIAQEKERESSKMEDGEIEEGMEGKRGVKNEKNAISSMEQLVAKMMLRRNDRYRSLANRKTPLTSKSRTSSPLVRYRDSVDMDMDEDESLSKPPPWTGDCESESGPRTLAAWTTSLSQPSSFRFAII